MTFSNRLISWYLENRRDLPWRNTTDPYVIWLSEIILQQTRVVQGLPYFEAFVSEFPTVFDLAQAQEEQF
jgi:A/G-specific adenine glycosylase